MDTYSPAHIPVNSQETLQAILNATSAQPGNLARSIRTTPNPQDAHRNPYQQDLPTFPPGSGPVLSIQRDVENVQYGPEQGLGRGQGELLSLDPDLELPVLPEFNSQPEGSQRSRPDADGAGSNGQNGRASQLGSRGEADSRRISVRNHPQYIHLHPDPEQPNPPSHPHTYHPIFGFPIPPAPIPAELGAIAIPLPVGGTVDRVGDDLGTASSGQDKGQDPNVVQESNADKGTDDHRRGPGAGVAGQDAPFEGDTDTDGLGLDGLDPNEGKKKPPRPPPRQTINSYMIPSRSQLLAGPAPATFGPKGEVKLDLPPYPPQGWFCPSYPESYPAPLGELYPASTLEEVPGWIACRTGINGDSTASSSTLDASNLNNAHQDGLDPAQPASQRTPMPIPMPIHKPNYPAFPHVERMHASALPVWLEARSREFAYFRHGDRKGKIRVKKANGEEAGDQPDDTDGDDQGDPNDPDDQDGEGAEQGDLTTLASAATTGNALEDGRMSPPLGDSDDPAGDDRIRETSPVIESAFERARSIRNRNIISAFPDYSVDLSLNVDLDNTMDLPPPAPPKIYKRRIPHSSYEQIVEWRCCWAGNWRVREVPSKTGKKRLRAPGIKVGCKARLVARSIIGSEDVDVTYHYYHEGHDPCDPEDIKKVRRGGLHPEIQAFIYGADGVLDVDGGDAELGPPSKRFKKAKPKKPAGSKRKGKKSEAVEEAVEVEAGDDADLMRLGEESGAEKGKRPRRGSPGAEHQEVELERTDPQVQHNFAPRRRGSRHGSLEYLVDPNDQEMRNGWRSGSRTNIQEDHDRSGGDIGSTFLPPLHTNDDYDEQPRLYEPGDQLHPPHGSTSRASELEDQNAALVGLTNLGRMPVDRMMSDVRSDMTFGNGYDSSDHRSPIDRRERTEPDNYPEPPHRSIYDSSSRVTVPGIPERPNRRLITSAIEDLHQASVVLDSLHDPDERGRPKLTGCDTAKLEMIARESHRLFRAAMDIEEEVKRKAGYEMRSVDTEARRRLRGRLI